MKRFPFRNSSHFSRLVEQQSLDDPLWLQIAEQPQEYEDQEGYSPDPVADQHYQVSPGVIHKYPGRVLLTVTGACAIHCRYCFRRHYDYADANPLGANLSATLAYLQHQSEVHEVILSGGDPLMLSTEKLCQLSQALEAIPHIQSLRIHSRIPTVEPERFDEALFDWFATGSLQKVLVLHCNHAREISAESSALLSRLRRAGVMLLNQSVLLRGVNDNLKALQELSRRLSQNGVIPYYLNQLDRVQGAAHFQVSDSEAIDLHRQLQDSLPGYQVPRLVQDLAGNSAKTPLSCN